MRLIATTIAGAAFPISATLLFVACSGGSGATGLYGDLEGGVDGPTLTDGGPLPDSGPAPQGLCPAQPPAQGASCTSAGLTCEFGGTGPGLLCSTIASCNGTSTAPKWFVNAPSPSCVSDPAHNPSSCPVSFGALATGAACPAGLPSGSRCVYDEGLCGCTSCASDAGQTSQWSCAVFPKPQGCPDSRPAIGSPCTTADQECVYGSFCSVLGGLPTLRCTAGMWERQAGGAACANPVCGTK